MRKRRAEIERILEGNVSVLDDRALCNNDFGRHVRPEQERDSYGALTRALAAGEQERLFLPTSGGAGHSAGPGRAH